MSFKSDRHRGRWGRRIPFLLFPTPWIAAILVMLGFSNEIGAFLHRTLLSGSSFTIGTIVLACIAILAASFQYFNMFVASVYYYLFNDVVPEQFLGRFMAAFRVVGVLASASFNFFVLKYADHHAKWILAGAGILYFVVFTLMCLKVKEGEYPPPPENVDKREGVISSAKSYFVECFHHPFYWYFFLATAAWDVTASNCLGQWTLLFQNVSLGIPLGPIGKMNALAGVIGACLIFPMGMLSDKKHPIRIMMLAIFGLTLLWPVQFIFLFYNFSPDTAYHIMFIWTMVTLPLSYMYAASNLPFYMRMLPQDRYGQFCSAQAMFRSLCVIVLGLLAGVLLDVLRGITMKHGLPASFVYRFCPVMQWVAQIASCIFMVVVYRYFKKLGGDEAYAPPAVECKVNTDVPELVPTE
ncbi:MAG TPA: MFS transporter [Armatimonadota bacterium]